MMAASLPWSASEVLTISVALSESPEFIRISPGKCTGIAWRWS